MVGERDGFGSIIGEVWLCTYFSRVMYDLHLVNGLTGFSMTQTEPPDSHPCEYCEMAKLDCAV